MKKDIYYNERIYIGCEMDMPTHFNVADDLEYGLAFQGFENYIATITSYEWHGSKYTFKDGEDVTGKYKLQHQHNYGGGNGWQDVSEYSYRSMVINQSCKRIVAVAASMEEEKEVGDYVLRTINTDKYYWCKCENCGWEDSSQYLHGGHAIADTGDYSDFICPVCSCNRIEEEPSVDVPDGYNGIVQVKIPYDVYMKPYIAAAKKASELEDKIYWDSQSPAPEKKEQEGNIPTELMKYFLDSFNETASIYGEIEKVSCYGGSAFVIFKSGQCYRLNWSLYNQNIATFD